MEELFSSLVENYFARISAYYFVSWNLIFFCLPMMLCFGFFYLSPPWVWIPYLCSKQALMAEEICRSKGQTAPLKSTGSRLVFPCRPAGTTSVRVSFGELKVYGDLQWPCSLNCCCQYFSVKNCAVHIPIVELHWLLGDMAWAQYSTVWFLATLGAPATRPCFVYI